MSFSETWNTLRSNRLVVMKSNPSTGGWITERGAAWRDSEGWANRVTQSSSKQTINKAKQKTLTRLAPTALHCYTPWLLHHVEKQWHQAEHWSSRLLFICTHTKRDLNNLVLMLYREHLNSDFWPVICIKKRKVGLLKCYSLLFPSLYKVAFRAVVLLNLVLEWIVTF